MINVPDGNLANFGFADTTVRFSSDRLSGRIVLELIPIRMLDQTALPREHETVLDALAQVGTT